MFKLEMKKSGAFQEIAYSFSMAPKLSVILAFCMGITLNNCFAAILSLRPSAITRNVVSVYFMGFICRYTIFFILGKLRNGNPFKGKNLAQEWLSICYRCFPYFIFEICLLGLVFITLTPDRVNFQNLKNVFHDSLFLKAFIPVIFLGVFTYIKTQTCFILPIMVRNGGFDFALLEANKKIVRDNSLFLFVLNISFEVLALGSFVISIFLMPFFHGAFGTFFFHFVCAMIFGVIWLVWTYFINLYCFELKGPCD